ncbi:hypothetical protein AMS68_002068 [Peltaster fructicola]|uniref:Major facilitator superfamily (MFS) profile domain-containing protein n=1 Tax=Peltaster fructicola TaxID=286661 RepID=A0A6H0XPH4_9PEZI|nr:hypothetical protein AMS68_002068 [Peltaster fructicola]
MSVKSKTSTSSISSKFTHDLERGGSIPTQVTIESEKTVQPLDWDGPQDQDNPLNWPSWKRTYHTLIPSAAAVVCTIASSIYTPAVDSIVTSFSVSQEVALLPFAFYILGLGFGPLLAAPCSETYGRRMVYLTSIPIFALFTLGAALSQDIASLVITRFFAGIFAGPNVVIGSATIADLYKPSDRAFPMTLYIATPFCGPAIAPLIGAYATDNLGWRWTMWATLIMAAAVILLALPMRETYKTVILTRRAKQRNDRRADPGTTVVEAFRSFITTSLKRPVHMACTEPIVTLTMFYIALNFAMLYSFFAAFPEVLMQAYGFGQGQVGLTFLAIGVGALIASLIILAIDHYVFRVEVQEKGQITPEKRLYIAMIASCLLPISLFWFGWTARSDIHWISPVLAEVVFSCGNMMIFMSFVLYLSDTYGARYTASAMTANTFLRYMLGATFPLWILYLYKGVGTGWATSVLAFLSLLMSPIPWVFYVWGPTLRARSKY